jgi:Lon protease-like protein
MERREIPLFPLNTVLFPGMMLPLHIFEDRYKMMIKRCLAETSEFGVVLLSEGTAEGPLGGIYDIGTTAQIKQVDALPDDRFNIVTTGARRFRVIEEHRDLYPYLTATIEFYPITDDTSTKTLDLARKLSPLVGRYLKLFKDANGTRFRFGQLPTDPLTLAFLVGVILPVENDIKQEILSMPDTYSILLTEYELLKHETLMLEIIQATRPLWATSEELPYYPN